MTDIIERAETALAGTIPGPWFWHGNTDHHGDIGLCGRMPGMGVVDVLRTCVESHLRPNQVIYRAQGDERVKDASGGRLYRPGLARHPHPLRLLPATPPNHARRTPRNPEMSVKVASTISFDLDRFEIHQGPKDLTLTLKSGDNEVVIDDPATVLSLREMCDKYLKINDDAAAATEDYAHDINNWLGSAGWAGA